MGDVKNLTQQEAIEKIKELAEAIKLCMFCTNLTQQPFETRPMSAQEVDEAGNIWFFSAVESNKNEEINNDNRVQLLFSDAGKAHFLSVYGTATVIKDREKTEELWNVFVKAWFQEGKDDPSLTLIRMRPESAYYWDTKYGKMISLLKIAASVVTGKQMDGGVEGKINVQAKTAKSHL
jgi:general stress protein 26